MDRNLYQWFGNTDNALHFLSKFMPYCIEENKRNLSDIFLEGGFILNGTKYFQWNITFALFQNE